MIRAGSLFRAALALAVGAAYTLVPIPLLPQPAGAAVSITVNSTIDNPVARDGNCTLREAVENANRDSDTTLGDCVEGSGPDVIEFSSTLAGQTISLRSIGDSTWGPSALNVSSPITIDGSDAPGLKISQIGVGKRLFVILPEGDLEINVTLEGGRANGDYGRGGGAGAGMGGAFFNEGILRVINSTLVDNAAVGGDGRYSGGAACLSDDGGGPNGGAAGSPGFTNDGTAAGDGGDGGFQSGGGSGGCAYGGPAGDGGRGGFGGGGGAGGGNNGGGGTPGTGGAGGWFGADGGNGTSVSSGRGGSGGGLGGAIFNKSGIVIIHNSTLTGNVAQGGGFGEDYPYKDGEARGGAVFNYNGTLIVDSSTISGNEVRGSGPPIGGAVYSMGREGETSSVLIENSILANSVANTDFSASETISTGSHNIIETLGVGWGGSPVITNDPLLGPLTDNGGPTQTMLPGAGSVAIDNGATSLTSDQRGVSRPQGSADDIGAVEVAGGLDLVLQETGGEVGIWQLTGTTFTAGFSVANAGPDWMVKAVGHFTLDLDLDVVVQNTTTGEVGIWQLTGTTFTAGFSVTNAGPDWMVVAVGHFGPDPDLDLVVQNTVTGEVGIWQLTGTTFTAGFSVASAGPDWMVVGVGEFTGDSDTDVVVQNTVTGEVGIWQLTGTTYTAGFSVASAGPIWRVRDVGAFTSDPHTDVVVQNTTTGEVGIWQLTAATFTAGFAVANAGPDWAVRGVGEFTGDAGTDLVVQDTVTGGVGIWQLAGPVFAAGFPVASGGPGWVVTDVGDFAP